MTTRPLPPELLAENLAMRGGFFARQSDRPSPEIEKIEIGVVVGHVAANQIAKRAIAHFRETGQIFASNPSHELRQALGSVLLL